MSINEFEWMTGFECSAFPQMGMDELELTQHDRFWASDLLRVRETGIRLIRYGIPWHLVNPKPHEFDWRWTDSVLDYMQLLGIEPVIDLFHFGTPIWLERGIMNPFFPDLQAEYTEAFVRRYTWIRHYTPTNEPYIMAEFGAEGANWYPFYQGPDNFVTALRHVARGICLSWKAIAAERPDARMWISDTCEYHHALDAETVGFARFRNERRFLMHELYGGRFSDKHVLMWWLGPHGLSHEDIDWFQENAAPVDIIGLDHYPHSEHQYRMENGIMIDEPATMEMQLGPGELARQYFEYFQRPVFFAETGAPGDDARKIWWMDRIIGQVREQRQAGVPLVGITWWGFIDQLDWDSGLRRRNGNINPTGLYELERQGDRLIRKPTAALDHWLKYMAQPTEQSVGILSQDAKRFLAAPTGGVTTTESIPVRPVDPPNPSLEPTTT